MVVSTSNRTGSGSSKVTRVKKAKSTGSKTKDTSSMSSLPGVQKIKSALRQTRRLLAKDNLAADVRVETERRLRSLESDLVKAQQVRMERTNAVKYHKVKFFERKKVCRKIKQTKEALNNPETSAGDIPDLQKSLHLHRVELNYIIHYPKSKKYIALFPSQSSTVTKDKTTEQTDRQREEMKREIQRAMEKGELEQEPELTLAKGDDISTDVTMNWHEDSKTAQRSERKGNGKNIKKAKTIPDDAFFEASDHDSDEKRKGFFREH